MDIRLDVKRDTFEKYLLKMGFSFNIQQYDDFISSIRRILVHDIKEHMTNNTLRTALDTIFKNINFPSILLLEDSLIVNKISSEYLNDLIENNRLYLFLEEKNETFTIDQKILSYKIAKIRDIKYHNKNFEAIFLRRYLSDFNDSQKKYIKAINYLEKYDSDLSETEKDKIDREINNHYKESILQEKGIIPKKFIPIHRARLIDMNLEKINKRDLKEYIKHKIIDDSVINNFEYITIKYNENRITEKNINILERVHRDMMPMIGKERKYIILRRLLAGEENELINDPELIQMYGNRSRVISLFEVMSSLLKAYKEQNLSSPIRKTPPFLTTSPCF